MGRVCYEWNRKKEKNHSLLKKLVVSSFQIHDQLKGWHRHIKKRTVMKVGSKINNPSNIWKLALYPRKSSKRKETAFYILKREKIKVCCQYLKRSASKKNRTMKNNIHLGQHNLQGRVKLFLLGLMELLLAI